MTLLPFILAAAAIAVMVLRADSVRRGRRAMRLARTLPQLPPLVPPASISPSRTAGRSFADPRPLILRSRERLLGRAGQVTEGMPGSRRTVAFAALAAVGVIAVVGLAAAGIRASNARPAGTSEATAARPSAAVAAEPSPPLATETVTPTAVADTGAPISGEAILGAWRARGLTVTVASETLSCSGVTPRAYRAQAGGTGQLAYVFVYASPPAMSADWAVERGSPLAFRKGGCAPAGSVPYWNQNAVVVFSPLTDSAARQAMSDAFLRLP